MVGEEDVDEWRKKLKVVVGKYRNFFNQNGEAFFGGKSYCRINSENQALENRRVKKS